MLKGMQGGSPTHSRQKSLPITPGILCTIHCVWPQEPIDFNKVMLWVEFFLAVFASCDAGVHLPIVEGLFLFLVVTNGYLRKLIHKSSISGYTPLAEQN